ncbi:MAG: vancomycin resistance protein [Ruminococcaceae bacterium]|nr:vancomycin resistance protein [Oscillospiraceae bacterium]
MNQKLFSEISPLTYSISERKNIITRNLCDFFGPETFAKTKLSVPLPHIIYQHSSLIRRTLGNTDMRLQENKAHNLSIAAPKVNGIMIRPGETFSFWKLVGSTTAKKGYKEGLTISNGKAKAGIGGGMCQFTNLIHWMVLHTPLEIVEHHHHDRFDLFPDFNRQIPFGTGTSIAYNYIDYRFKNTTKNGFQLIVYLTDTHLCGELRSDGMPDFKYHIIAEDERFVREGDTVFREGKVYRNCIDKKSGKLLSHELIRSNHAQVMYDTKDLVIE